MSGPKTSHYTLTPEQRRVLMEQREHRRRVAEQKALIKLYRDELSSIARRLKTTLISADALYKRTGDAAEYVAAITSVIDAAQSAIISHYATDSDNLNQLNEHRSELEDCTKSLRLKQSDILIQSDGVNDTLADNLHSSIDRAFSLSFKNIKRTSEYDFLKNQLSNSLDQLEELCDDDVLFTEVSTVKKQLAGITTIDFLQNFKSMTVAPLKKRVQRSLFVKSQFINAHCALTASYNTLCDELSITPQKYNCISEDIDALSIEIANLEAQAQYNREQEYIATAIDEIMAEMGYDVLGQRDVTKKNGKHFKNKLFNFDDGTAVNVTYASDGKITMELGGIDTTDRLPTTDETAKLCSNMQSFCDDFSEVEKKLKRRGVTVKDRISIMPPDEQYAQIINTDDYELLSDIVSISAKSDNRNTNLHLKSHL